MNLRTLIDETANRADELLDGCTNPSEAHALIVELLAAEHPALPPPDLKKIADHVTSILKNEGFFESAGNAGAWSDDGEDDEQAAE